MNLYGSVKVEEKTSMKRGQSQIHLMAQKSQEQVRTSLHGVIPQTQAVGSRRVDFLTNNQSRAAKRDSLASTGLIHGPIQGVKDNGPD